MRVLVRAYTALNLGDDLFLDTFFRKYPNVMFEIESWFYDDYKRFTDRYHNASIRKNKGIITRIKEKFKIYDNIDGRYINRFDLIIHIGGSIFKENPDNDLLDVISEKEVELAKKKNIPYYFLSCNFGPFYTEEFVKRKRKVFENSYRVFFRDKYSYEMFKDIKSVGYSEDVVFSSPYKEEFKNIEPKKILGISVIDFKDRSSISEFEDEYQKFLVDEINKFIKYGYKIRLFAFSVREGDLSAAERLYNRLSDGIKDFVEIIAYRGRIDEIVYPFAECEKIICTRFHSMVLAIIAGREFYPIIYSEKLLNIIEDMSLCSEYYYFGRENKLVFSQYSTENNKESNIFRHFNNIFGIDNRTEENYN